MTNPQEERTNILKGCGQMIWVSNAFHSVHKVCGKDGDLCLSCQARLSQHDKTMKLVIEEINKIGNKEYSDSYLEATKQFWIDEMKKSLDSPQNISNCRIGTGDTTHKKRGQTVRWNIDYENIEKHKEESLGGQNG